MSIVVPLTQGLFTIIDDEDLNLLGNREWHAVCTNGCFYARDKDGNYLHRIITNCPIDKLVDHVNGITLDNRKGNLRICTYSQNSRNSVIKENNQTGFKGVCFHKNITSGKPYQARIYNDEGKRVSLGYYASAEEAAKVYANAAKLEHGEFANTGVRDNEPFAITTNL